MLPEQEALSMYIPIISVMYIGYVGRSVKRQFPFCHDDTYTIQDIIPSCCEVFSSIADKCIISMYLNSLFICIYIKSISTSKFLLQLNNFIF